MKYKMDKQTNTDESYDELRKKPDVKFGVSIPLEYKEILEEIAVTKTKQIIKEMGFMSVRITRNAIIKEAIGMYIKKQGYVITKQGFAVKET